MDLPTQVNKALERLIERKEIISIRPYADNDIFSRDHFISYSIAPSQGIYDISALNVHLHYLSALLPDIEDKQIVPFLDEDSSIRFGQIDFKEKIGEEKIKTETSIQYSDSEIIKDERLINKGFNKKGFRYEKEEDTKDIYRNVHILVAPDKKLLSKYGARTRIVDIKTKQWAKISEEDYIRHREQQDPNYQKPGLLQRIFSLA